MKTIFLIVLLSLSSVICAAQNREAAAKTGTQKASDEQLISCVKKDDADCVARALAAGADANAMNREGSAALMLAAEGESAGIVQLLLDAGAQVNKEGQGAGTPLCRAALFGREKNAEILLRAGAKINIVCDSDHGDTPLMEALRGAWLRSLSTDLKEEFAGMDDSDGGDDAKEKAEKWRVVLEGPSESFLAIARSLLARGADVNVAAKCSMSETALMYAAMSADIEMVKEILSRGAKIEQATPVLMMLREFEIERGKTIHLALPARSKGQSAMLVWLEKTKEAREEIKRLLKAAGAKEAEDEADEEAKTGEEALEEAAHDAFSDTVKKNDMKELERLIEAYSTHPLGARALPEALRLAVIYNRREMVKLLLARGVNPNGARYNTLVQAASNGNLEYVQLLLEAGADVNATDGDGRTALDAAESWSSSEEHCAIVEALKARGAKSKREK